MKIKTIVASALEKYTTLVADQFYDISHLALKIKSPSGVHNLISIVKKIGKSAIITFDDGSTIHCSDEHYITTTEGSYMVCDLKLTDVVVTATGTTTIENIVISDDEQEFYDVEVDSEDGLYYTANGICHHNTGKTANVEDVLEAAGKADGNGYFKVAGSASAAGLYRILFDHKTEIILFDDADSALQDIEGRNLIKAAADTSKRRKISWMKGGGNYIDPDDYEEETSGDKLPRFFDFTGKIIFISNLSINKLDPDGALRTRAYLINIDPTNMEMYEFMGKIADKIKLDVNYELSKQARLEVIEILKARKVMDKTVNLRQLVRGLNTRAGIEQQGGSSEEWKKFVKLFA